MIGMSVRVNLAWDGCDNVIVESHSRQSQLRCLCRTIGKGRAVVATIVRRLLQRAGMKIGGGERA